MTGNHRWFSSLTPVSSSEHIIVGDKGTGKVKGVGAVSVSESFILRDVALVGNLGYDLLSVSQLLEVGYEVRFKKGFSRVLDAEGSLVCPVVPFGKVFCVDFLSSSGPSRCFVAGPFSDLWKRHRRHGHLSFDLLAKLSSLDLIRGLPKLKSGHDLVCHPCRHGKMVAASHTPVNQVMTAYPGELLHMDTVGPSRVRSVGGKWYVLVIVDDFSCWSWVQFMESKDEVFEFVHDLVLRLRNESGHAMRALRSDNGSEFKNDRFKTFCQSQGLEHQFSSLYVPQQNGVVERKNRTLVEMARMMLDEHRTPRKFWAKAINTACYVSNRIFLRAVLNKTSYELRAVVLDCYEARYTASPRESHRTAVRRILRHIKFTLEFGLWYSADSSLSLLGFSDSDHAGCRIDRKSTFGTCQFLGTSLVSWSSRKQSSVATSTCEAECVAALLPDPMVACYPERLWPYLWKDSHLVAISVAKNPVLHSRTKHIDVRYHFLRDNYEKGMIDIVKVASENQVADVLTKALDLETFARLRGDLGVVGEGVDKALIKGKIEGLKVYRVWSFVLAVIRARQHQRLADG
ncbi:hypothetical protein U9M48_042943 [Paspalum notatum var. saurae]|uniref:Integrase catalytic domain-containing protein n=1 Tax=Paspalum notatum var. saurae TaxID=547442 RepID=A0AAQ3UTW5_PASNO